MKSIASVAGLVSILCAAACATGAYATPSSSQGDGGVLPRGTDGGGSTNPPANGNDGGTVNPPTNGDDAGNGNTTTCTGTMCGSDCVDTTSDPNNCGGCGNACDASQTCTNGQCTGGTNSNEPPQGTCSHSLCSTGNYLDEGCDTEGCTVVICDPEYLFDDYCCDTDWDQQCIDEVNTYCSPYSCN